MARKKNDKASGYKHWRDNRSRTKKEYISETSPYVKHIGKHKKISRKRGEKMSDFIDRKRAMDPEKSIIEKKRLGNIKKKNIFDQILRRKKEKGLVKKIHDDVLYEDDPNVIHGRRDKYSVSTKKEEKKMGREHRKYVQQGEDEEGDPLKKKLKIKGKYGRDVPTYKEKEKRVGSERKYVVVEDGKRVKKRGDHPEEARRYVRKGLRRQYVDPDAEGKYTYVSGKEIKSKNPKQEKVRKNKINEKKINKANNRKLAKQQKKDLKSFKKDRRRLKRERRKQEMKSWERPTTALEMDTDYKQI